MPIQLPQNTILWGGNIQRSKTRPQEAMHTKRNAYPTNKEESQSSLGIMKYLRKVSPTTAEECELLRKKTSSKHKWTRNETYQNLYDRANNIVKKKLN